MYIIYIYTYTANFQLALFLKSFVLQRTQTTVYPTIPPFIYLYILYNVCMLIAYRHTTGIIIAQIYVYIIQREQRRGLPIVCFKSSTCDDNSDDEQCGVKTPRGDSVQGRDPFWKSASKYLPPWETGQMTAMICSGPYTIHIYIYISL